VKRALIVGHTGQDGQLLFDYLKKQNYQIVGVSSKSATDITVAHSVFSLVETLQPDEIYFLAAHHHSAQDVLNDHLSDLKKSYEINVFALAHFLEAIKIASKHTRLFYASSSLIFGPPQTKVQDESHPRCPDTVYGITKLDGMNLCKYYSTQFGVWAASGILFNHESHLRRDSFLSKKIISKVASIYQSGQGQLSVGNLQASADWGYAPDYVEAFHKILNVEKPDEFIVATGVRHTVLDFIKTRRSRHWLMTIAILFFASFIQLKLL